MILAPLRRLAARLPLHVVLLALCAVWLVSALGLLVTSFRPVQDVNASGW